MKPLLMIPIWAIGLRRDNLWRAACILIALLFVEVVLTPDRQAWAQAPQRTIGLNPGHPSPDPLTVAGKEVSSTALVENANAWNGRLISFKGEAIGERMVRGDMAWIHLNDDAYMEKSIAAGAGAEGYNSGQAIWLPSELALRVLFFGNYQNQGDLVKITGVFHAACPEHGGDMDIHATELTVVALGHPVAHEIKMIRAALAASLMLSSVFLFWIRQRVRSRRL